MKKIAVLGYGTVGGGVADVIDTNRAEIESRIGDGIEISYILDLRSFEGDRYADRVTSDFDKILSDTEVETIVETMGGSHPAYDFSVAAIKAGKNVVTSNKEVVANFGAELISLAAAHGVRYLFEASVGGGIPIIRPMIESLAGNRICSVTGILNGTTNYILTEMADAGKSFDDALREAQEKGYAEKDPTADIEGIDSKRKICILAALAFGRMLPENAVKNTGIGKITPEDVRAAAKAGAKIKLLGHAEKSNRGIFASVEPYVINAHSPLGAVDGVYNGIIVSGNALGDVMFYGSGAGKLPTASAVVSDIMDILTHPGAKSEVLFRTADAGDIDSSDRTGRYMIRTALAPHEGLMALCEGYYIADGITASEIKEIYPDAVCYPVL